MDIGFNDNESEIDMREMEQERGLGDNSVVAKAHNIQNEMIITEIRDGRCQDYYPFQGRKK